MNEINFESFLYILFLTSLLFAFYNVCLKDSKPKKNKNALLGSNKKIINLHNSEVDYFFKSVGLKITGFHYNVFRLVIAILLLIINGVTVNSLFIILILYFFSIPKKYLFNYKSPFYRILELLRKEYRDKQNTEIYNAIIQLKNICISTKDKPISSDFMLEHIGKFTNYTKPVFMQTLSMWRVGDEEKAILHFSKSIDTKIAEEFASFLPKLDRTNPSDLVEQLNLLQSSVREIKTTSTLRKQEIISNLMFIPIVSATLIILLNFIVITIWLNIQI